MTPEQFMESDKPFIFRARRNGNLARLCGNAEFLASKGETVEIECDTKDTLRQIEAILSPEVFKQILVTAKGKK